MVHNLNSLRRMEWRKAVFANRRMKTKAALFYLSFLFAWPASEIRAQEPVNPWQQQNLPAVQARVRYKDDKGKMQYSDWKKFPTVMVENLDGFVTGTPAAVDAYGGDPQFQLAEEGYFRVVKMGRRWYCADPLGNRFFSLGINSITPGRSERNKAAFDQKYGSSQKWMEATADSLHANGFNSAGSWSDTESIIAYNAKPGRPLVYSINGNFMSEYGRKRGGTYAVPGHTGYPGNVIFVFDPAFESFCDDWAKQFAKYKDDKNLFGYFSDNEMPFNLQNLEGYLSLPDSDYGKQAARQWLQQRGKQQEQIDDRDRQEFLAYEADRYFSIVSKAIRRYDPHHLYLGCRFYSSEKNVPAFMQAAGKYIDILSINYYGAWTASAEAMRNWSHWSGRPFIVTEYYTKAEDSGLPNLSGAGWIVRSQADRGKFYQNFCLSLLQSGNCVGWHWFKYQDNDPTEAGAELSNTDANKGIVDNYYNFYDPLLERMKALNQPVYRLADYFDRPATLQKPLDLYLLIGQSNMSGRGYLNDYFRQLSDSAVFMLNKNNDWVIARHPLHFDKPKIDAVGPGLSFGIAMAKASPQHLIGLVPCAVGGTSITTWVPGAYDKATKTHPYDDMLQRVEEAKKSGHFKGIIWLQGESDSREDKAATYIDSLQQLIQRLRVLLNDPDMPFVAGQLGHYRPQYENINKQLKKLPRRVPFTAVASSKGFTDRGDQTHFNAESADKYGKRFAQKMLHLLKKRAHEKNQTD